MAVTRDHIRQQDAFLRTDGEVRQPKGFLIIETGDRTRWSEDGGETWAEGECPLVYAHMAFRDTLESD